MVKQRTTWHLVKTVPGVFGMYEVWTSFYDTFTKVTLRRWKTSAFPSGTTSTREVVWRDDE